MVRNCLFVTVFLIRLISVSAYAEEPLSITGKTMGSYYSVIIDHPGNADADQLKKVIEGKLAEINRQMSTWDADSEISNFNQQQTTDWISVSREFAVVTQEAIRLHHLTEGAVDVTLAPLIDLWGFGKEKRRSIPDDGEITRVMKNVGTDRLSVRLDPPAIRKEISVLQINLSCLAPGFAADEISVLLRERGHKSHVVDVGGENLAGAAKSGGEPWRLGIESPLGGLQKVVPLTDLAIATSGDYRSFFVIQGRKYSHILNPKTGRPVENPPASVSVIHKSCMTADGFATAMMVLGSKKGLQIAEKSGIDVMFQDIDQDGRLIESGIGRFVDSQ